MSSRQDGNGGYWVGIGVAVILIAAAFYLWRDDLGRWISGTPSVGTDETTSSQTDQPAAEVIEQLPQPEAPAAPPPVTETPGVPASSD